MIKILLLDNIYNDIIPNWYYNIYEYNVNNYTDYLQYNNENQTIKLLKFLKYLIHLQNKYEFIFVSDCGYKRENNIYYHYRYMDGIEFNNKEKLIFNKLKLKVPLINNNIYFMKEYLKNDYDISLLLTNKNNIKMNIIGPNTYYEFLYNNTQNNDNVNIDEIITNLKYQILSTVHNGCKIIQIDEPYFIYKLFDETNIDYLEKLVSSLNTEIILGLHKYDEFKLKSILTKENLIQLLNIKNIKYYSFDYQDIQKYITILKDYNHKIFIFKLNYRNYIKDYKVLLKKIIDEIGHNNFYVSPSNYKKTLNELNKIYENIYISVNYLNHSQNIYEFN